MSSRGKSNQPNNDMGRKESTESSSSASLPLSDPSAPGINSAKIIAKAKLPDPDALDVSLPFACANSGAVRAPSSGTPSPGRSAVTKEAWGETIAAPLSDKPSEIDVSEISAASSTDYHLARIRAEWASSSGLSAPESEEGSDDVNEERAAPSEEDVRVAFARSEALEKKAAETGFFSELSHLDETMVTRGKRVGGGGAGDVFELDVVDSALKKTVMDFTKGDGVILKQAKKVRCRGMGVGTRGYFQDSGKAK